MKRLFWILTAGAIVLWSLLTWGTYALVTGAGDFLVANADLLGGGTDVQYWLQWSLRLLEQFGVVLLWIVWAVGAVLLVATAAIGTKAATVVRRMQQLR
jgi:hypothetical protein